MGICSEMEGEMNKTVRLAVLVLVALTLTCLCLARPGQHFPLKVSHSNCVQYCRSLGLLTHQTCDACYCFAPAAPPVYACSGCDGTVYTGCGGGWYGGWGGGGDR